MNVKILYFLILIVPVVLISKEAPPNIILIMADDLGRESVGCYGGTSWQTPSIDRLAEEGVKFEYAFSYPLCTNTRVALMTGKYNFRNWKAFGILDPEETTFGHLFQDIGYRTCMVGKWQLQSYDPPGYPGGDVRRDTGMRVEDAGFDEFCMWHVGHTEEKGSRYPDPLIYENGQFRTDTNDLYGPDVFTEYALDFIERSRDESFFLYYPMALPHNPFVPTPDSEEWSDRTKRHQADNRFFGDMVEYTDKILGKFVRKLEELGLRKDTVIIFYTDNGTNAKLTSMMGDVEVQGGKGKSIDGGCRVPLVVSWPSKMKSGIVSNAMVDPNDFIPTLFEVVGRPLPASFHTDGQSFLPFLKGEEAPRRDWVFIEHDPRPGWDKENFIPEKFVRGYQYKLYGDGRFFDVASDPLEQNPIIDPDEMQRKVIGKYEKLMDELRRYRTIGRVDSFDPSFDEIVPPTTKIEVIAEGFDWSEGPVWVESLQALLFSDVPRNTVYKWTFADGLERYLHPAGYTGSSPRGGGKGSNGLAIDSNGTLILCRHGDRELSRMMASLKQPVPVFQALATGYDGKKFNSPNDLTFDTAGNIYFTDPNYGLDKARMPGIKELPFQGVYRLSTEGELELFVDDLESPNGVALSPDERTLYVANSRSSQWFAYDVDDEGNVSNGRVFFDGTELVRNSISGQKPDGMVVNSDGILFATGPDGVIVLSPEGEHLGTIFTGKNTSNCDLNEDETVLYVTCDDLILRVVLGYKLGFSS